MYYMWKNIKKSYKNNKLKISALTWNEKSESPDGLYSVSDIQDYSEYSIKKHQTVTENPSIRICVNKIENRINKIKEGNYFKLLTLETTKLLGST